MKQTDPEAILLCTTLMQTQIISNNSDTLRFKYHMALAALQSKTDTMLKSHHHSRTKSSSNKLRNEC